jgi:hypothetical protein
VNVPRWPIGIFGNTTASATASGKAGVCTNRTSPHRTEDAQLVTTSGEIADITGSTHTTPRISVTLGSNMHDDFVKAGGTGERAAVFFPFLDFAFAVGGADDEGVIVGAVGSPIVTPERPG